MAQHSSHKKIEDGMGFFPELLSKEELITVSVALLEKYVGSIVTKKTEKDFKKALIDLAKSIEAGYHDLVYHKFSHAVDVAHLMDFMLSEKSMTSIEDKHKFYLVLTALVHDLGHFGVTNTALNSDFGKSELTKAHGRFVLNSKKQTVMEAFHIEKSHELLDTHPFFSRKDVQPWVKDELRVWFTSLILATDLANQNIFLDKIKNDPQGTFHPMTDTLSKVEAPSSLCLLLIKLSDMGNVFREYDCAFRWTEFVIAEGDSTGRVVAKFKANKTTPTTLNLLQAMQAEQGDALKRAQAWTVEAMEARMLGFAQNFVWPIVFCMKNFNTAIYHKLGHAIMDSLMRTGPKGKAFMDEIAKEIA